MAGGFLDVRYKLVGTMTQCSSTPRENTRQLLKGENVYAIHANHTRTFLGILAPPLLEV